MNKQILQIENTTSEEFKSSLVKEIIETLAKQKQVNTPDDKLLTRQQTAEMLSISLVTLWQYTKKDILPALRIGNKVRYKKSEILLALQQMNKFSS